MKAYAAAVGLSVQPLCEGRKQLREKGQLAPGRPKVPRFSKVAVAAPVASPSIEEPLFRVTLSNGAVLE